MDDNKPTDLTEKELHSMRYHLQYHYLPMLVATVEQNPDLVNVLRRPTVWRSHLTSDYPRFTFEWDELQVDAFRVDDDHLIFVYIFPEPKQVPDAFYGAVLYDTANNKGYYYTLEKSYNCLMFCGTDTERHSNYGSVEHCPTGNFVDWVVKLHIPDYQY